MRVAIFAVAALPLLLAGGALAQQVTNPLEVYGGSATSPIDLQTTPPINGAFFHPNGTYLQMCSAAGCPSGPHMFAQTFGQATTRLDGTAQEIGAFFNYKDVTGYAPNWQQAISAPNTVAAYSNNLSLTVNPGTSPPVNAYVTSNNNLFKARASCVTASSGQGPGYWSTPGYGAVEPTANNVPDGTCVFDYAAPATYQAYAGVGSSQPTSVTSVSANGEIFNVTTNGCQMATSGDGPYVSPNADGSYPVGTVVTNGSCSLSLVGAGVNDGKTGFSLAGVFGPGGGNGWGYDDTMIILPGFGTNVWYRETDTNNENMDSFAGSPFLALAHFDGGGSAYTYPIFAYYYLGSGAVNSKDNQGNPSRNPYGAHYGWYCSGQPGEIGSVCKDAAFADASNSSISFQVLGSRAHGAGFEDDSNSTVAFKVTGTHSGAGIDLTGAAVAGAGGTVLLKTYTIATLPICAGGTHGAIAYVNDSVGGVLTWHGNVVGGGTNAVNSVVSCNGASWIYE